MSATAAASCFFFGRISCAVSATYGIIWQAPRGPVPLGTYALDFATAEEGVLQGQVVTIAGPVEAAGSVQLEGRAYQLDILVSSEGSLEEQLQQALSLIAAPEAQGYRAKLNAEF